jgi:hypothetical protein
MKLSPPLLPPNPDASQPHAFAAGADPIRATATVIASPANPTKTKTSVHQREKPESILKLGTQAPKSKVPIQLEPYPNEFYDSIVKHGEKELLKTERDKVKADKRSSSPKISGVSYEHNTTWIDAHSNERLLSDVPDPYGFDDASTHGTASQTTDDHSQDSKRRSAAAIRLSSSQTRPSPEAAQCPAPAAAMYPPAMRPPSGARTTINLVANRTTTRYHNIEIPKFHHTFTAPGMTTAIITVLGTTIEAITALAMTAELTNVTPATINAISANSTTDETNAKSNALHAISMSISKILMMSEKPHRHKS